ncbi:MAG: alpha/beta fold hydrolase, partial [Deltaproteobacteria bacterium]
MNRDYSLRKNTIESGRFVIPYRVYENNGPHIICLNGVQQSMAMWHSFIQRFAHKYRTVLFDFPNQGKGYILSGAPRASLDEEVDILDKVIKATRCNGDLTLCSAS